jgi:hypothetical protein
MSTPSFEERLRHIALKLSRAKEHLAQLKQVLAAFIASAPYQIQARRDPATRKPTYFVAAAKPIPDSIPLIAGDAIQNLMSALDHLAYQLVCKDASDRPPNPRWIYFPIADDEPTYEAKKRGKMLGAGDDTFKAVDALKPFKGGNDLLWSLYRLNNVEKHRLLFTVGAQAAGIHLGQLLSMHASGFSAEAIKDMESLNHFLLPADTGFPIKEGFELYIGGPDEEVNPKLQFKFVVVLNEAGIAEGQPLLETVQALTNEVERVVDALVSRLN